MCKREGDGLIEVYSLAYVLGGHHHGHSHDDHDHDHEHNHDEEETLNEVQTPRKETNINLRAAALHVLGDLLASVGKLEWICNVFKINLYV